MAFNRDTRPTRERHTFDNIGVKRALRQKISPANGLSLDLEYINKRLEKLCGDCTEQQTLLLMIEDADTQDKVALDKPKQSEE